MTKRIFTRPRQLSDFFCIACAVNWTKKWRAIQNCPSNHVFILNLQSVQRFIKYDMYKNKISLINKDNYWCHWDNSMWHLEKQISEAVCNEPFDFGPSTVLVEITSQAGPALRSFSKRASFSLSSTSIVIWEKKGKLTNYWDYFYAALAYAMIIKAKRVNIFQATNLDRKLIFTYPNSFPWRQLTRAEHRVKRSKLLKKNVFIYI